MLVYDFIMNLLSSSVIVYITLKVNNNSTTTLLLSGPRESQQKVKENLNLSQFVKELVENKCCIFKSQEKYCIVF